MMLKWCCEGMKVLLQCCGGDAIKGLGGLGFGRVKSGGLKMH